ncbi:MAG: thiol:disulfide oxidoreductase [Alphaproteobacteria bacterium]|nr:MAG: thiol:disulfide oxidoreductase [Alphaproteobacteria bacterium]
MIDFYFFPSPNGLKVAIMLEECGLAYRIVPVDIGKGEQFDPAFLKISPNNKIPAIVDRDASDGPLSIFESGAILIYLAEKSGRFLPRDNAARFDVLQWLMWQVGGLGPMAGQAHHFRAFAPEKVPYAIRRYTDECNRLYGVIDRRLEGREYVCGAVSIADFAIWPWIVPHERQGQNLDDFPRLKAWYHRMEARPGVQRGLALGPERMMDQAGYKFLYGQTAERVSEMRDKRSGSDT